MEWPKINRIFLKSRVGSFLYEIDYSYRIQAVLKMWGVLKFRLPAPDFTSALKNSEMTGRSESHCRGDIWAYPAGANITMGFHPVGPTLK